MHLSRALLGGRRLRAACRDAARPRTRRARRSSWIVDREPAGQERGRSPGRGNQVRTVRPSRAAESVARHDRSARRRRKTVRCVWLFSMRSPHWATTPHRRFPRSFRRCAPTWAAGGRRSSHQDYRSALALAAIGKPAVEGLRGLLKERKDSVRAEAAMALGRIGPDAAAAVPDLIRLLGDKNERIGREASLALGRIGTAATDALLIAAAAQRSERSRERSYRPGLSSGGKQQGSRGRAQVCT